AQPGRPAGGVARDLAARRRNRRAAGVGDPRAGRLPAASARPLAGRGPGQREDRAGRGPPARAARARRAADPAGRAAGHAPARAAGAAAGPERRRASGPGALRVDDLALVLSLVFLAAGLAAVVMSLGAAAPEQAGHGEYHALLLSAIAGMLVLVEAQNLVSLFLGLELLSISLYVLCASEL